MAHPQGGPASTSLDSFEQVFDHGDMSSARSVAALDPGRSVVEQLRERVAAMERKPAGEPVATLPGLADLVPLHAGSTYAVDSASLALALAAGMGFRRIVGVELFESLCRQARENIDALARRDPGAAGIELLCMDAAAYQPPPGPLFCYFYNPFDDVVMRKVLARLEAACRAEPRPIIIAYSNPQHAAVFDSAPFLTARYRSDVMCVYVGGEP
jgi:hypothetical protein